MTEARFNRIEDEMEAVKTLLFSAASYAESANRGLDQLTVRIDGLAEKTDNVTDAQRQTQTQIDQLTEGVNRVSSRVDEFVFHAQRLFTQQATRLEQTEWQTERLEALEAIMRRLDRNYEAQQAQLQEFQAQMQEFQRTTNAALERIDRILDYLLRQLN